MPVQRGLRGSSGRLRTQFCITARAFLELFAKMRILYSAMRNEWCCKNKRNRVGGGVIPAAYRTPKSFARPSPIDSPHLEHLPYAISVRRSRVFPAASFRCHLRVDTFPLQLAVPVIRGHREFCLQVTNWTPHQTRWRFRAVRHA